MEIIVTRHQRDFRTREWSESDSDFGNFERFVQWIESRIQEFHNWEHPTTKVELLKDRAVVMFISGDGVEYQYYVLESDASDIPKMFARLQELAERYNLPTGMIRMLRGEPWFVALQPCDAHPTFQTHPPIGGEEGDDPSSTIDDLDLDVRERTLLDEEIAC